MTAATFTTAPKVELEFRCDGDGCAEQWRCWSYRKLNSDAVFLAIAKRHRLDAHEDAAAWILENRTEQTR